MEQVDTFTKMKGKAALQGLLAIIQNVITKNDLKVVAHEWGGMRNFFYSKKPKVGVKNN